MSGLPGNFRALLPKRCGPIFPAGTPGVHLSSTHAEEITMRQDVVPRLGDSLEALKRDRHRGRVPRDVVRAVEREHGGGLVGAARLDAGAHVARTALINTAMLTKDEETFLQFAPLGEARYKAIADAYAIYAAGEVGQL
jgi:hypothetical protein